MSRRFVAATGTALGELLAADLSGLDLVAFMVDGVHFAGHCCIVALGIGLDGIKIPFGAGRGLHGERHRGDRLDRRSAGTGPGHHPAGLGGHRRSKALRRAIVDVFDHPLIQRCQLHKVRNVEDKLPDTLASTVAKKMRAAYRNTDPLAAEADLEALARQLDKAHPGAAGSLREGLAETLTIGGLKMPPTLARTLRSTNAIESMIEIPGPLRQRETLAGRRDGAALVCRRDARSRKTVPPESQRLPAPARPQSRS